jgi:hypothetical protein
MGQASFTQNSFLGGEWSALMQGRFDLPKYRTAMNLCSNFIPLEEGAVERRSGTLMLAPTRLGYAAKLIGWAPTQSLPYLLEFTDSNLRFFYAGGLVTDPAPPTVTGVTNANPGVFTVGAAVSWSTGDQVMFLFPSGVFPGTSTGPLQYRQFTVTMDSTTTFTLKDAVTGAAISGVGLSFVSGHYPQVARITTLTSPFVAASLPYMRWIPFTSAQNITEGVLLAVGHQPQLLSAQTLGAGTTTFAMAAASLTDGPYLDPVNGEVATMTAGSGTPTIGPVYNVDWTPASGSLGRYNTGDIVSYQGAVYISTTGGIGGTNVNNVPGTNSAWVLCDPTLVNSSPPYFNTWTSGGSYTAWNGSGSGSTVYYNGQYYVAVNRGTHSFVGSDTPGANLGITESWAPVNFAQISENITGIITMELSFATWSSLTTYAEGDTASYGSGNYISLVNGNLNNEPDISTSQWATVPNAGLAFGPDGAQSGDVGRLIRLFYQPPVWQQGVTYVAGQSVTYGDPAAYYTALEQSTGAAPPVSLNQWQAAAGAAYWVPGIVTAIHSATSIDVQLNGSLTDATPITLYQAGVYTDTNSQWPTCGCFYQGRLWLAGAVPNRVDSSVSDDPLTFTPTATDGTVADSNGISFVFNSDDDETILWMKGVQQGILVGTRSREWMISASTTNDPITPATAEINPVTHYGSAFVEPKTTGLATVFVQKFQRQMLEMVANVFSGKYNAPNLALTGRHITAPGIAEIAYQEELAPVIWARMNDGSLAGCTYRRLSAIQTDNPVLLNEPSTYAAWHRHSLGSGRTVTSITMTLTPDTTLDQLAMVTEDANGVHYVEVMMPLADVDSTLETAWFVDSSAGPSSQTIADSNTEVIFYGYNQLAGQSVDVWAAGLDCGTYTVGSDGSVTVPIGAANGLFTLTLAQSYDGAIPAAIGFAFTSEGQIVRPATQQDTGSRIGPAQGETRRAHMFSTMLFNTQGISFGTDFDHLYPAQLSAYESGPIYPVTQLFTGIHWDTVADSPSFDGMLCWQVSRPYPATVVNIGGWVRTAER